MKNFNKNFVEKKISVKQQFWWKNKNCIKSKFDEMQFLLNNKLLNEKLKIGLNCKFC